MTRIADLARLLDRHTAALGTGTHDSAVPRLALIRAERPTERMHAVYRPSVCITAQGVKRTIAGERVLRYGPGDYLTISVDLPVVGEVTAASKREPYLCLKLQPDPAQLSDLLIAGSSASDEEPDLGLAVAKVTDEIVDAAVRLAGLLDRPEAIAALAPLYERELCYFLLQGPQGARLRQLALGEGRMAQIARAIRFITDRFREPIAVEEAAAEAGMSASSFHQHFKAVTAQSPLQFQKLLRLQEARRLLVAEGGDAASAAFAVGYSSPQQFNREYARLFGLPPQRDAARLRAEDVAASA